MFGRVQRPEPDAIEVVLGPRATFAGTMRSETSIRVDGAVDGGLIETPANVILTEGARVTCEIVARTVSIRGSFHGTIRAERVELLAGSRVSGVLIVSSYHMDEGVVLQAEVNVRGMQRPAASPLLRGSTPGGIPIVSPHAGPKPIP